LTRQITGLAAHDLNNLLTTIVANLEIAASHATSTDESTLIAETLHAAEACAIINRRLLNCVGIPKHPPVVLEPGNIQTSAKVYPDLWNVYVDPGEIRSALINLALNAQDAMPDGGNLTMELCNKELSTGNVELSEDAKPGNYVRIMVSDTGTGMTVDVMENALQAFFTTKQGKGCGLGLNSVNEFVQKSRQSGSTCQGRLNRQSQSSLSTPDNKITDLPKPAYLYKPKDQTHKAHWRGRFQGQTSHP